jgi:hypothetical protein
VGGLVYDLVDESAGDRRWGVELVERSVPRNKDMLLADIREQQGPQKLVGEEYYAITPQGEEMLRVAGRIA